MKREIRRKTIGNKKFHSEQNNINATAKQVCSSCVSRQRIYVSHHHYQIVEMESKSSYLSSKGTSISSMACVSCRRCLHHRRHHHRVRFNAALDNHDDGHTTTTSMNGDNQENQQSIMRDTCLLTKTRKEEDDSCRQNIMMKQAEGMCEIDGGSSKANYFNNISPISSLTTTAKSISLISGKGQLGETRICQQYFFSKER